MLKQTLKGLGIAAFAVAVVASPFVSREKSNAQVAGRIWSDCDHLTLRQGVNGGYGSERWACNYLVQQFLNEAKLLYARYAGTNVRNWPTISPHDGLYGPQTKAAVANWQNASMYYWTHGPGDGVFGPGSWLELSRDCYKWSASSRWGNYKSPVCG